MEHPLFRRHSVISRAQALRRFSPGAVRHRVGTCRWQRAHRSIYVAMTGTIGLAQRRRIAILATRGVLAGFCAHEILGLKRMRGVRREALIHVEIDGSQHMEVRAGAAAMRQHNDLADAGARPPRFTARQVRHEPADVARQFRAALTRPAGGRDSGARWRNRRCGPGCR